MADGQSSDKHSDFIFELEKIIASRKKADPASSYTARLLSGNINRLLQKVGEESVEYILEAKGSDKQKIISEGSDLLFHFMVSLQGLDLSLNDIINELYNRHVQKNP